MSLTNENHKFYFKQFFPSNYLIINAEQKQNKPNRPLSQISHACFTQWHLNVTLNFPGHVTSPETAVEKFS